MINARWQDAAGTMIVATRADGSAIVIEADADPGLWAQALAGAFGPVAPYSAPPEPSPDEIAAAARSGMSLTRRQVIIGMVLEGLISQAEGIAMSTAKTPPAAVETMLAEMPEPQQTVARITLADFTVAYRLDPMVALFQTAGGLTDAQMDAFFVGYAAA